MLLTLAILPFVIFGVGMGISLLLTLMDRVGNAFYPPATVPVPTLPRLEIVQGKAMGLDTCSFCGKTCQFDPLYGFYNCWNCGYHNLLSGASEWPMSPRQRTDVEEARGRRRRRTFKIAGVIVVLLVLAFIGLFIYAATLPNSWSA